MGLDAVGRPSDTELIRLAIALAGRAASTGDVPIGALVLAPDGVTVGEGWNAREATGDPTAHAEIIALRHGYHGRSVMNMTATGHAPWKRGDDHFVKERCMQYLPHRRKRIGAAGQGLDGPSRGAGDDR